MQDGGTFLLGGYSSADKYLDTIYQLKTAESQWTELDQKLKVARDYPTVVPIAEEVASCQ